VQTKGWLIVCAVILVFGIVLGGAGWWYFIYKPERERSSAIIAGLEQSLSDAQRRSDIVARRLDEITSGIADALGTVGKGLEVIEGIANRNTKIIGLLSLMSEIVRRLQEIIGTAGS